MNMHNVSSSASFDIYAKAIGRDPNIYQHQNWQGVGWQIWKELGFVEGWAIFSFLPGYGGNNVDPQLLELQKADNIGGFVDRLKQMITPGTKIGSNNAPGLWGEQVWTQRQISSRMGQQQCPRSLG